MARRTATFSTKSALSASMRVIVLHGKDSFLIREKTRQMVDALTEAFGEIEQFRYDGESAQLADVLDELRSYGLIQRHKLVILDKADEFLKNRDDRREALSRYAAAPVEDATLLLRAETWRPSNLDKTIQRVGAVVKCDPPSESTAVSWCVARCERRYDATLDAEAAQMLVARIGADLGRLDTELQKLASFVGTGQRIEPDHIRAMVQPTREEQAWEIQSAVLTGDPGHALTRVCELLDISRQPEQLLMWSMVDLIRKLHATAQMLRQGASEGEIARELKLWGSARSAIPSAARRGEPDRFARLLDEAVEADRRSKSGDDPRRSLEGLAVLVADELGAGGRA